MPIFLSQYNIKPCSYVSINFSKMYYGAHINREQIYFVTLSLVTNSAWTE